MNTVTIHTDGSCFPNPGNGGWGAILHYMGEELEIHGGETETTNNRMEMTAIIMALETLKTPCKVKVVTDSQYAIKGASMWGSGLQKKGWMRKNGKPVPNADLWQRMIVAVEKHRIEWVWVRGHHGHALNERADRLANKGRIKGMVA